MKRPAAASSAPAKRGKTDVPSAKLNSVKRVVKGADAFPSSVRTMVCQDMALTLGLRKEERHAFQERVVQMIGEILTSVETGIQAKIAAAEAEVADADRDNRQRQTQAEAAFTAVDEKVGGTKGAQTRLTEEQNSLKGATKALSAAKAEQKTGDAPVVAAAANKEKLEKGDSLVNSLKEGTLEGKAVKEAVTLIAKLAKEFSFDSALLTSIPSALSKALAERGSFDLLVIDQVKGEFAKNLSLVSAELTEGEAGKQERAAKVTAAEAALELCTKSEADAKAALDEASKAQKEAEDTKKAADKALKQFGPQMKAVQAKLDDLKTELKELQEGALAEFKELSERSVVVEPAVVAEAEPTA
eukprot:TRINITY_DN93345_c0_g1_i1.p1 TRINITY_DN93345_c0_g1~~TRINITY_DN93345_c0_g1_i1.p1  ORF type:complete len:358 (+),score=133.67 TRINITY_DN93345_c0_g1_i1:65-1138(+)